MNLYSGRELLDLCRAAGFADMALFGDLEGQPYGLAATRLVARARTAGRQVRGPESTGPMRAS